MVTHHRVGADRSLWRMRLALLAAALATFGLLYAPQSVLPQLADHFGLTPARVSLTISAATGGLALAGIPLAAVAQAVGRRRLMVGSLVTAVLLGLLLPVAASPGALIALRAVQGVAVAGVPSVAMAYVADEIEPGQIGATMGIYVTGTSFGGLLGRIAAGVVADLAGWRAGLLAVGAGAALATVVFAVLLPAPRGQVRTGMRLRPLVTGLADAVRDPALYAPYLVAVLGMGGFVAVYNVLSFRLVRPPLELAPALASLAFLAYLAGGVTSAVAGWATGRWSRPAVLLTGLVCALAGLAATLPDSLGPILAGLVVFTAGFFCAHAVATGWVTAEASPGARGQAAAIYLLAFYVGSSVGGTVGSGAYGSFGWLGLAGLVTCWLLLAMLAVLLAPLVSRRRRP